MTKKFFLLLLFATHKSEMDNPLKHALPGLDCKKGIDYLSLFMPLNIPYYTFVFPNYSCNKQKVLNKKSPLTEVFIQFLYGKWHNYMEEKEYMYTDIMGQTLHYMITQWQ